MATIELSEVLKNNIIPIKSAIHDCADTLGTQTLVDGIRTLYTNDKVAYEYKSGDNLWDSVNSVVKDTIQDSKIDIKVGGIMNAASANTLMKVEVVIPATAEIPVNTIELGIGRVGVDILHAINFNVYNGADAVTYGFQIYLTAVGGNIDIKNKNILVRI